MLATIEIRNAQGGTLSLPLVDISNGYALEEVNGLDPVKATLVSSSYAAIDGALYQSARREPRNITMVIGLEPDYVATSVRDLRTALYSFLMPKTLVELRFIMEDLSTFYIMARVESLETVFFSAEPQVNVSLMCFDPDFLELDPIVEDGVTVETSTETLVTYGGTVETGFVFELLVDRILTEFTIYNRLPDDSIQSMDFAIDLESGDVLTVSTIVGNKYVNLLRAGITSSVLYGLSPQSTWLELQPGDNNLRVYAVGAPIIWSLTYSARHGGL